MSWAALRYGALTLRTLRECESVNADLLDEGYPASEENFLEYVHRFRRIFSPRLQGGRLDLCNVQWHYVALCIFSSNDFSRW